MQSNVVEQQHRHDLNAVTAARQAVADYEDMEVLEAPAFTDEMSKQEMIDHLVEYHGCLGYRVAGKEIFKDRTGATKPELLAYHEKMHTALDNPSSQLRYRNRRYKRDENGNVQRWADGRDYVWEYSFTVEGFPIPKIRHRHAMVRVSEKDMAALSAVRNNKRAADGVLSVRDRKTLTELVNNDFNALKQEMRAFASDSLTQKIAEVNQDWDEREKKIPDFATEATELYRKHQEETAALRAAQEEATRKLRQKHEDAFQKVTEKADAKGVTLKQETKRVLTEDGKSYVNKLVYVATVQGRKDAIAGVERENKSFLDRALMTLEKQRLTAQRQVLLSGIPQDAMPIVESIPDAKSLMVQAQQESNAKQLSND